MTPVRRADPQNPPEGSGRPSTSCERLHLEARSRVARPRSALPSPERRVSGERARILDTRITGSPVDRRMQLRQDVRSSLVCADPRRDLRVREDELERPFRISPVPEPGLDLIGPRVRVVLPETWRTPLHCAVRWGRSLALRSSNSCCYASHDQASRHRAHQILLHVHAPSSVVGSIAGCDLPLMFRESQELPVHSTSVSPFTPLRSGDHSRSTGSQCRQDSGMYAGSRIYSREVPAQGPLHNLAAMLTK